PNSKMNTKRKNLILREVEIIYSKPVRREVVSITKSVDAELIFRDVFDRRKIEHKEFFYVLLLNRANECLGVAKISEGGLTSTVVDIREIFQLALKTNATAIILAHNHPSGNIQPSEADNIITRKVSEAGKLLEIILLDHIILTKDSYFSYADEGKL